MLSWGNTMFVVGGSAAECSERRCRGEVPGVAEASEIPPTEWDTGVIAGAFPASFT